MPVTAYDTRLFIRESPPGSYISGLPVGAWVWITIDIESPIGWDLTTDGIVGWTFNLQVDPAVLRVWSVHTSNFDYYLYDCVDWNQDPFGPFTGDNYPTNLVAEVNATTGFIGGFAEFIFGWEDPGVGAGGDSGVAFWYGEANGLCQIRMRSLSETEHSLIDIQDAYYYTPAGKFAFDVVDDGHYNPPSVPEFPLGAAVEVGLIVAVAYIWWTRRRRLKEVPFR
jgi:hypothetical protein